MVQDANKPPLNQIDVAADPVAAIDIMIDALRSMPSHPDLDILDGGTDIEIVKSAYAKCKDMYSGKEPKAIKVLSDGDVIYVGWQGMKHALSDKGNVVKALASTCIEDLIQKSYFVEVMVNKHGETKPDIKETLLYQSKMLLDKVPVDIGIVVRVFKDGRKMYDYFVANKNPVSISDGHKSDQPLTGSLNNISTLSEIVKGRSSTVKTPKGTKLDTVFALVEADDVIASHDATGGTNPKFPQELQPRDRSREASQAWVQKTAANLDPDSLGKTSRADTGAPIVGDDLIVESGNGRTMAIQLAYARGTANEYRDWLLEEAEYFGFKPEHVEAFKQPVLVRIRKTEVDRAAFAVEANQDDKLSLSATERAKADARRIDSNMAMLFNPSEDGDLLAASNTKFIQAFLTSIGDTEAAQYIGTDGKPTQSLVARIKAAVFSKAYRDDRLLEMVADQTKPDLKNMLNALSVAAPKFIEAQAINRVKAEDLSSQIVDGIEQATDQKVIDAIIAAANVVMTAKNDNQDVSEFVKQQGLFGDLPDGVAELAVFLSKNAGSAKKMSLLFKAMASYLEKQAIDQSNNSLFGEPEPVSMRDVIAFAASVIEQEYGDKANLSMFDSSYGFEGTDEGLQQLVKIFYKKGWMRPKTKAINFSCDNSGLRVNIDRTTAYTFELNIYKGGQIIKSRSSNGINIQADMDWLNQFIDNEQYKLSFDSGSIVDKAELSDMGILGPELFGQIFKSYARTGQWTPTKYLEQMDELRRVFHANGWGHERRINGFMTKRHIQCKVRLIKYPDDNSFFARIVDLDEKLVSEIRCDDKAVPEIITAINQYLSPDQQLLIEASGFDSTSADKPIQMAKLDPSDSWMNGQIIRWSDTPNLFYKNPMALPSKGQLGDKVVVSIWDGKEKDDKTEFKLNAFIADIKFKSSKVWYGLAIQIADTQFATLIYLPSGTFEFLSDESAFDALLTFDELERHYHVRTDIDRQAHEAATSPYNDLPEPTDEQKLSGDYVKGKLSIASVDIAIENPAGSIRSGVDASGKAWQSTMQHHYGYIENTMGADGDELDVFVKTGLNEYTGIVYVIRQVNPDNWSFDEHKIIIGASTLEEAQQIYLSNYEENWAGMGSIEALSIEDFRNKLGKTWNQFDSIGDPMDPLLTLDQLLSVMQAQKVIEQQQLMELREEIRTKEQTARYLMGGRKGLWGRTTNADNKRSAELSNLRLKYHLALDHFIATYSIE